MSSRRNLFETHSVPFSCSIHVESRIKISLMESGACKEEHLRSKNIGVNILRVRIKGQQEIFVAGDTTFATPYHYCWWESYFPSIIYILC